MADIDAIGQKYEMLRATMNERMRRLWAASEALASGWGGISLVAKATGLARKTIHGGIRECEELSLIPTTPDLLQEPIPGPCRLEGRDRIRRSGGGRKLTEVEDPAIVPTLERLITNEVGGDPMSDRKWVRCSLRQIYK
jgi:hypothetical protein